MESMAHRSPLVVAKAKLCSNLSALRTTVRNLSTVRAGATVSCLAPRIVSSFFSVATGSTQRCLKQMAESLIKQVVQVGAAAS